MPRLMRWAPLALLVLGVAAEGAGSVSPHHGHSRSAPKARHHEAQALPKVPEHRGAMLERANPKPDSGSNGTAKPMCSTNPILFQQVVADADRRAFFKEGVAKQERMFGIPESLPRACQHWIQRPQCCTRMWYHRLDETTGRTLEEFNYIRDQYFHFKEDTIEPALKEARDGSEEAERLKAAADEAQKGIERVLDFVDQCEDPLRLFFASTACSLCAPDLDANLTEGQILHIGKEGPISLAKNCSEMPDKLKEAGLSFLQARNMLTTNNTSQEKWYAHAFTWLDRAAKLTLLRSKEIREKYVETTFEKELTQEGYVYRPEKWGDVLLLHISVLATDEEKATFIPQDELRYFVPQEDRIADLRRQAETIETEFSTDQDNEGPDSEDNGTSADNNAPNASSLSELGESSEDQDEELKCVHGRKLRYHCQCAPCYTGVHCDKKMNPGPDVRQEFEPLVAQRAAGAQQELAVQGCQLHTDLRYQLARITLIPLPESGEGKEKPEKLCKKPQGSYSNSLRLRVPELVSPREYVYLIDVPVGAVAKYQVCYCYGVDCMDTLLDWQTTESLQGWFGVGQVEVVNTHEERDAMVLKMFEPTALKERRKRETPAKLCSTNWYLKENDTFIFVRKGGTVNFKCSEGFANLKGVEELICDDGTWKVSKHSEDNPMEAKLSPPDMSIWEDGQFPECSWNLASNCSAEDPRSVVAKEGRPVMNNFAGDGQVHYRCSPFEGGLPMRLVIKHSDHVLEPGEEVVFNRSRVAQIMETEKEKYKIKLLDTFEQLSVGADLVEWLPQDTSYIRRCSKDGKYVPANVQIRCLLVFPSETDKEGPVDDQSAKGDFASGAFVPEQAAAAPKKPPASAKAETSLLEQRGSSLLEASSLGGSAVQARTERFAQVVDKAPPLRLLPWPVILSEDSEHVLHVDSCWISTINCSDGSIAKDTARALQRESIPVLPPPVAEEAVQRSWGLAGCVALALVLVLMLLGWSSQSPSESERGKRGMPK